MENLQSIFSDPTYSMMASRSGLHPETYWQTLHPKAKEQHLSRVGAAPATYVTEEQYANSQAVGANSGPNAYLSNNPVLAGYDGNPMQPGYPGSGPSESVSPALSSSDVDTNVYTSPGALAAPEQDASMVAPGNPVAPVLSSDPSAVEEPAPVLSSQSNPAAAAPTASSSSKVQSSGRAASPSTGNARGSQMGYGKANTAEMLMRVGGVMQANAVNGYGAAMGAASNEYGKIQDDRRAADTAAYEAQEAKDAAKRLADAKVRAASAKAGAKAGAGPIAGGGVYQQATLDAITAIEGYLDTDDGSMNPFNRINGWTGNFLSSKAGSPAHDVAGLLKTVVSSIGFDRLDAMRKASKTGGALGSITEGELRLLQSSLGSLQQSSTAPEFRRNLTAVRKHYQSVLASIENDRIADANLQSSSGSGPSNSPASEFNPADYTVEEME